MTPPRATILIPSYNHAPFVVEAVESALAQSERDVEVLVIDDGSTDDSVARLGALADPRLVVHVQENVGLSRTLNRGLARARARWVKFLPSDDALEPPAIERQLAVVRPGVGVVFSLPQVVDAQGAPLADPVPQAWFDQPARDRDALLRGLLERNFLCAPGALFDRQLALAVGGFDESLVVAQDYDLWLKMLERSAAAFVAERLVRVRWHGANQSAFVTAASEAERAKVVEASLARLGIDAWLALFRAGEAPRADADARRALAAALRRSGLATLAQQARRLECEVAAPAARAARGTPLERLGAAWRRLRGRRSTAAATTAPIAPGRRPERWLVVEPRDAGPAPAEHSARLASALAAGGADVDWLARRAPFDPPSDLHARVRTAAFDLHRLRALLHEHDDRLRVLALAAEADVVALAREARLRGARILYYRTDAAPQRATTRSALDTEQALIEAADDLIGGTRSIVKGLAASRRIVHLLPVEGGEADWDAHAASLCAIADVPTVAAVIVCGPEHGARDVAACVGALLAARAPIPYRVVALDDGATEAVRSDLEVGAERGEIVLLRNPRRGWAAAANLALRATASELVVLLDAGRIVPGSGWLDAGVARLLADRTLGALVARGAAVGESPAAWLAPRAALARAGGFDEGYAVDRLADLDLEQRLSSIGYAVDAWPPPVPAAPNVDRPVAPPARVLRGDERRFRRKWRRSPAPAKV